MTESRQSYTAELRIDGSIYARQVVTDELFDWLDGGRAGNITIRLDVPDELYANTASVVTVLIAPEGTR